METAKRTLIKSPPEVWEMVNDEDRARAWISELTGLESEIEAAESKPERLMVWRSHDDDAELEFSLSEKGWGTNVSVRARPEGSPAVLENVLDELAATEVQPFSRD